MPFALLDDKFHSNAKVYAAGNAGAGLYARALSYCADHLTDGFVPEAWVKTIGTPALLKKLEVAGLWRKVSPTNPITTSTKSGESKAVVVTGTGYWIPDYLEHNPSRADVEAKRKVKAEAGKKGAERRWHSDSSGMAPAKQVLEQSHDVGNAPRPRSPSPSPIDKPLPPTNVNVHATEEPDGRVEGVSTRRKTEAEEADQDRDHYGVPIGYERQPTGAIDVPDILKSL